MAGRSIDNEKFIQENLHKYFQKLSSVREPIVLVLTIHLYTEFWINKCIELCSPKPKEILDKNFVFSTKLMLVYNMGLIPEQLYLNIKKLNTLRNKYAHNLDYDFTKSDLNYIYSDGKSVLEHLQGESDWRIFMLIGASTFEWMANHVIKNYMTDIIT
ncbi:hypothetical protein [Clostridium sp.]|uniref:hypothetical protein n=1 Tax=Clostridium sp. TaxID=1506 RepID=UPI003D6CA623